MPDLARWNRRRVVLAVAMAAIGLAGAVEAQIGPDPVDLQVVDRDTGQVLPIWRHHGRLFVAGQTGDRYGLRVTNHTDGRVLVVMSVDGVNILTGETAGWGQRGYVFDPGEVYDLTGWRKSNTEVAAFNFAPLPQSYAARTGRPTEVGVIGIAVFKERVWAPPPPPVYNAPPVAGLAEPAPAPALAQRDKPQSPAFMGGYAKGAADSVRQEEKLGTGHGAREWSVTRVVTFERATPYPQFTRQIEYDTYANLVARGVIHAPVYGQHRPRPFPQSPEGGGYVPDPPGDP